MNFLMNCFFDFWSRNSADISWYVKSLGKLKFHLIKQTNTMHTSGFDLNKKIIYKIKIKFIQNCRIIDNNTKKSFCISSQDEIKMKV